MPSASPEVLRWAIVVTLGLALLLVLRQVAAAWLRRRQLQGRFLKARQGESDARELLEAHGYAIVASQFCQSYTLAFDRTEMEIPLRADYLVQRNGLRFVAEVKTGAYAPQVRTGATRRQLLEYRLAFDVEGVLLVDAEKQRVHVVRFPLSGPHARQSSSPFRWVLVGAGLAWLVITQWR
jgi:hypothetical protein